MKERQHLIEQFPTDGLTPEEDEKLAILLERCKGRISTPVFTELARMIPQPIVEVVIFRKRNGILETLLIPRPKDDIVWPNMLHTPGSAIRTSDFERTDQSPLNGAFERIQNNEIHNQFSYTPVFVDRLYRKGDRGCEVAEIYFTEISETQEDNYNWSPIDQLSQNPIFIQIQLEHIKLAAEKYQNKKS